MKVIDAGPGYGSFEFPDHWSQEEITEWFGKTLPKPTGEAWNFTPPTETEPVEAPSEPPPPDERGFLGVSADAFMRGTYHTYGQMANFVGLFGDLMGYDEFAEGALNVGTALSQIGAEQYPTEVQTFQDIDTWGDLGNYAAETVFQTLPLLIPTIAGGMLGGAAGAAAGGSAAATSAARTFSDAFIRDQLTKRTAQYVASGATQAAARQAAARDVAEFATARVAAARKAGEITGYRTGAAAGGFPTMAGAYAGQKYQDIYEITGKREPLSALAVGAGQGAIELLPVVRLLDRTVGPLAAEQVRKTLAGRIGSNAVEQAFLQAGIEGVQQTIDLVVENHYDPERQILDEEGVNRIVDGVLRGGIAGGALVGAFGAISPRPRSPENDMGETQATEVQDEASTPEQTTPVTPEHKTLEETLEEIRQSAEMPEPGETLDPTAEDFLTQQAWQQPYSAVQQSGSPINEATYKAAVLATMASGQAVPSQVLDQYADTRQLAPTNSVINIATDLEGGQHPVTVRAYEFAMEEGLPAVSHALVEFADGEQMRVPRALLSRRAPPQEGATPAESPAPALAGTYSNILAAVEGSNVAEATGPEWQSTVQGMVEGRGLVPGVTVRAEELDFIGLPDWLAEQPGKVSREDVAEYIRANQIDLQEQTVTEQTLAVPDNLVNQYRDAIQTAPPEIRGPLGRLITPISPEAFRGLPGFEQRRQIERSARTLNNIVGKLPEVTRTPEYQQLEKILGIDGLETVARQLRDVYTTVKDLVPRLNWHSFTRDPTHLQNYRIQEISLSDQFAARMASKPFRSDGDNQITNGFFRGVLSSDPRTGTYAEIHSPDSRYLVAVHKSQTADAEAGLTELNRNLQDGKINLGDPTLFVNPNHNPHARNLIATARMSDTALPDGRVFTEIHEIQSDWHQQGQRRGFGTNAHLRQQLQERPDATLQARVVRGPVPDVPFKKNWHELALKRAMREAASMGRSGITLPLGQTVSRVQQHTAGSHQRVQEFYDKTLRKAAEKYGRKIGAKVYEGTLPNLWDGGNDSLLFVEFIPEAVSKLLKSSPLYAQKARQLIQSERITEEVAAKVVSLVDHLLGKGTARVAFANDPVSHLLKSTRDPAARRQWEVDLQQGGTEPGAAVRGVAMADTITIAMDLTHNQALMTGAHEAFHVAENIGLLTPAESKVLYSPVAQERLRSLIARAHADGHPGLRDIDLPHLQEVLQRNPREVLAYGTEASLWYQARGLELPQNYGNTFQRFANRLYNFFIRLGNWLNGRGFRNAQDVIDTFLQGGMAKRVQDMGPYREQIAREYSINYAYDSYYLGERGSTLEEWGKNSAIKTPDGRMKVVYHATPYSFRRFERSGDIGFHFGNIDAANNRFENLVASDWIHSNPEAFPQDAARVMTELRNILQQVPPGSDKHRSIMAQLNTMRYLDTFIQQGQHPSDAFAQAVSLGEIAHDVATVEELGTRLNLQREMTDAPNQEQNWNIIPAYLNIENPLLTPDMGDWPAIELLDELTIRTPTEAALDGVGLGNSTTAQRIFSKEEAAQLRRQIMDAQGGALEVAGLGAQTNRMRANAYKILREAIRKKGFDGIMYVNEHEGISTQDYSYIAFAPQQIKSLFGPGLGNARKAQSPLLALKNTFPWPPKSAQVNTAAHQGWFKRTIPTPRHLASIHPKFVDVYWDVTDRQRHRLQTAQEMSVNGLTGRQRIAALSRATKEQQRNVTKALELLNPLDLRQLPLNSRGLYEITNPGGLEATLSKPGETITLTPEEGKIVDAIREGTDYGLESLKQSFLAEMNLAPNITGTDVANIITTAEGLLNQMPLNDPARPKMQSFLEDMRKTHEAVTSLEELKGSHYMPRVRFGDRGLAAHRTVTLPDGTTRKELIGFYTFESGGANRFTWKQNWARQRDELTRKYAGDPTVTISDKPFYLTRDYIRNNVADQISAMDLMGTLLSVNDRQQYARMVEDITQSLKARGFNAHTLFARNVPGYSHDIVPAFGRYIAAVSSTSANLRYNNKIMKAVNRINPSEERPLHDYAKTYAEYSMNPQEEWAFFRNLGFGMYLGANLSSAALQWSTLPIFTATELSMVAPGILVGGTMTKNFAKVSSYFARETPRIFKSDRPDPFVVLNPHKMGGSPRRKAARTELWDRGVLKPQRTPEQVGIASELRDTYASRLGKTWQKTLDLASITFNTAETMGRLTVFETVMDLAEYYGPTKFMDRVNSRFANNNMWQKYVREGRATPEGFAEFLIDDSFGAYGKANRAPYSRHAGAAIFQFNTYPQQMIELMTRMLGESFKNKNPHAIKALAMMTAMLFVFGGVQGWPGTEDIKEIVEASWAGMGLGDLDIERELRKITSDATGSNLAAEVMARGPLRALTRLDLSKRATLGNIPAADIVKALLGVQGDPTDALGVPGSLTLGALRNFGQRAPIQGIGDATIEAFAPAAFRNIYTAVKWNRDGVRTLNGDRLLSREDLTDFDIFMRGIGYNTSQIVAARESMRAERRVASEVTDIQSAYYTRLATTYDRIRDARRANNPEEVAQQRAELQNILAEVRRYNQGKPAHQRVILDPAYIRRRVRQIAAGFPGRLRQYPTKTRAEIRRIHNLYNFRSDDRN